MYAYIRIYLYVEEQEGGEEAQTKIVKIKVKASQTEKGSKHMKISKAEEGGNKVCKVNMMACMYI